MKIEEMQTLLEQSIPPKRYKHSMRVYETALDMAKVLCKSKEETQKIAISSLLHDCGREVGSKESVAKARELGLAVDDVELHQPILLHAKIGVYNAMHKYGVTDEEVLDGIRYHTTGAAGMTDLAKIVYLADMIEPARDFPGVDKLREVAYKNLDKAMLMAYSNTMRYLLDGELLLHPRCIEGYNELIVKLK